MATKPDPADDTDANPGVFSRSNVLSAFGIGLITAFLADQEHAPFPVGVIVAVVVALTVLGMIALKRAFRRD
jgi:urea transporter